MNFHHVVILTCAIVNAPITTPEVGVIRFTQPDALWYAVTTKLGSTPANLPIGPMIPIVAAARPDVDGIKKDIGM